MRLHTRLSAQKPHAVVCGNHTRRPFISLSRRASVTPIGSTSQIDTPPPFCTRNQGLQVLPHIVRCHACQSHRMHYVMAQCSSPEVHAVPQHKHFHRPDRRINAHARAAAFHQARRGQRSLAQIAQCWQDRAQDSAEAHTSIQCALHRVAIVAHHTHAATQMSVLQDKMPWCHQLLLGFAPQTLGLCV